MTVSPNPPATWHDVAHRGDLERLAAEFAALDAIAAEVLIDARAAEAIARWRLDDATFWQRVKFRARLIRATRPPPVARTSA